MLLLLWIPSTKSIDSVLGKNFDGTFFGDNNPKCGAVRGDISDIINKYHSAWITYQNTIPRSFSWCAISTMVFQTIFERISQHRFFNPRAVSGKAQFTNNVTPDGVWGWSEKLWKRLTQLKLVVGRRREIW